MNELSRTVSWDLQMQLWGYDTAGQVVEFTAMISEQPEWDATPVGYPLWDHDAAWLLSMRLCTGDSWRPVPDWWALPHIPKEHL